ncbi:MAG: hypothetical protein IV086_13755 [Hyphomonadaceae bacterium]|nr:MAG: hypothetical protein FD160_3278 [Caulobacteraceae bacterium]MBT9446761.1 hypothetical protein [Hyphomonadaceae bacterium]
MRRALGYALCAALVAAAGVARADTPDSTPPTPARNVAIPFVENGAIKGWRSGGEDAILIEARSGRWYRGEFRPGCPEVRASEAVAFLTSPAGVLDHFSSVLVRDRVCRLRTLTDAPNPRLAAK